MINDRGNDGVGISCLDFLPTSPIQPNTGVHRKKIRPGSEQGTIAPIARILHQGMEFGKAQYRHVNIPVIVKAQWRPMKAQSKAEAMPNWARPQAKPIQHLSSALKVRVVCSKVLFLDLVPGKEIKYDQIAIDTLERMIGWSVADTALCTTPSNPDLRLGREVAKYFRPPKPEKRWKWVCATIMVPPKPDGFQS